MPRYKPVARAAKAHADVATKRDIASTAPRLYPATNRLSANCDGRHMIAPIQVPISSFLSGDKARSPRRAAMKRTRDLVGLSFAVLVSGCSFLPFT